MSQRLAQWVSAAPDARQRELRQAVHTILVAIAEFRQSGLEVVIKGGILLAVEYSGDRYTKDVDFSTTAQVSEIAPERFEATLNAALAAAAEKLDYGLDCRVQSRELDPPGDDKSWQTLKMKVGYAPFSDARRHGRLARWQAVDVVSVEISYNEVITGSEVIDIGDGREIVASTLADLVAEKYRAMIQQPIRKRVRRQDAYDLYCLIESRREELESLRGVVLDALRRKAEGRGIKVTPESLQNPEVERRSETEYPRLADEIGRSLPDFGDVYGAARGFYESLPWS